MRAKIFVSLASIYLRMRRRFSVFAYHQFLEVIHEEFLQEIENQTQVQVQKDEEWTAYKCIEESLLL